MPDRPQRSRWLRTPVLAALLATASAAAVSAQAPDQPYQIPVILSLTGQAAFTNRPFQQSLELVEKQINATGGIAGHPLELVYYDDASNPQVALTLASQQIAKNAPLLLGPGLVATCQAVMPLVVHNGPVTLCYSGLIPTSRGTYMFAANISAVDQYRAYLRFLRARGWLRISLLFSTDATGQAGERAYDYLLGLPENRSVQVVSRDHLSVTDLSVDAQLQHVRSANPDVLVTVATGPPFGTILRAYHDAGLRLPVASSAGNMTYAQMQQYKSLLPDLLFFPGQRAVSNGNTGAGPVRDAQQRYFAAFAAAGIRPESSHLVVWDPSMVMMDAVRRLGVHATALQIRDYIENLHGWIGINGVYDFGDAEHRGIGTESVVIFRWDAAREDFIAASRPGGTPALK